MNKSDNYNNIEDLYEKSIYPKLDLSQFQSINDNIIKKKKFIGKSIIDFYDYKMDNKKIEKKPIILNKIKFKRTKTKLFFKPKRTEKIKFLGRTQNIKLPKEEYTKRIKRNLQAQNYLDLISNNENNKLNQKESFFLSLQDNNSDFLFEKDNINKKNNQSTPKLNLLKLTKKPKKINKRNFNNSFLKTVRKLDYDNGLINNHIKREKKVFDNIFDSVDDRYKLYHWKFIMTQNEKDLRPDTIFGKGEEFFMKKSFNKQLDSMINKLKNVDAINIRNIYKRSEEHSHIDVILKKRIKEEKDNRDFINKILERSQVISNLILKKDFSK